VLKVSVVVTEGFGQRDGALQQCNGEGIYYGKSECNQKKFKGFPCFSRLKILKTAFMGYMELWLSRQ
jgi:hypothetical protein